MGERPSSVAQYGNRQLEDEANVFEHNAWDNVKWTEEMEQQASEVVARQHERAVSAEKAARIVDSAAGHWDAFYRQHANRFFKDRHWLRIEFPELFPAEPLAKPFRVLEVGCGAGNTVFPLLEAVADPNYHVVACDFAASAVEVVRANPLYAGKRCTAFVWDAAKEDQPLDLIPDGSIDVAVLIFVLSAMHPGDFDAALARLYRALAPGGVLLFRDYGQYDLAQLRFKDGHCLGGGFYARGDGTCVYFFSQADVERLAATAGFTVEQSAADRRLIVNRGKKLQMQRVWIQAKLRKPL